MNAKQWYQRRVHGYKDSINITRHRSLYSFVEDIKKVLHWIQFFLIFILTFLFYYIAKDCT
eukprot:TRINITY_DN6589_c0_g1_i1.p2 TRINITY_DN6589_c0_g1~~TRINITY_DN6589_c0_g1_i1.p2  ORF type:complete len:61 (+),score=7.83 TRINITY_DN6589_c0_g1_i1:254-436(+)